MQKTLLIGNLGKDPELRNTNSTPVCSFSVVTVERWKDQQGNKQEKLEWHRVIAWNGLANTCGQYLKKGSRVYIEGKNRTRKWTDQNGVERYITEVHASEMEMLNNGKNSAPDMPANGFPGNDDVPF